MRAGTIRNLSLAAAALIAAAAITLQAPAQENAPRLDVIFVPTPHAVVKRMLELAKVGPDDIHYDLGSGDGRIAIASVKDFKAKKSVGIDLDPQRIRESLDNHAKAGVGDKVTFLNKNIFETDFSEATVVSLYLLPTLNLKLRPTILDMKPGTRIVTQSFHMDDWKPDHTEDVPFDENYKGSRNVYLFVVPAKVEGKWTMADGGREITLDIRQKFQEFGGTATVKGKSSAVKEGKLDGAKIEFTIEIDGKPVKYEGAVNGGVITGAGSATWSAKKS
jgi:hypothetical protein